MGRLPEYVTVLDWCRTAMPLETMRDVAELAAADAIGSWFVVRGSWFVVRGRATLLTVGVKRHSARAHWLRPQRTPPILLSGDGIVVNAIAPMAVTGMPEDLRARQIGRSLTLGAFQRKEASEPEDAGAQ